MNKYFLQMLLLFSFLASRVAYGELLLHKTSSPNKVTGVHTACDMTDLRVTVKTEAAFDGAIYAKGYPTECNARGDHSRRTDLIISPQECGVKIVKENGSHMFQLLIYVQYDSWVQQATDEQVQVSCSVTGNGHMHATGTSSINVFIRSEEEKEEKEQKEDDNERRSSNLVPKSRTLDLNTYQFSVSDLYPSNMLKVPSKLQQMVLDHFKQTKEPASETTPRNLDTVSFVNTSSAVIPIDLSSQDKSSHSLSSAGFTLTGLGNSVMNKNSQIISSKITLKEAKDDTSKEAFTTSVGFNVKSEGKNNIINSNSQILSSGLKIKDPGNTVPYKGIFRASPKVVTKSKKDKDASAWQPLYPSVLLTKKEDNKFKSLLKKEDEEETEEKEEEEEEEEDEDEEEDEKQTEEEGNDEKVSCWLDVSKGNSPFGDTVDDELLVGETATLVIRVQKERDLDTKVVSCQAHDGSGNNVQLLLDQDGCSVDKEIMPTLKRSRAHSSEELNYAPFKVFKFPDHDSLHLKCTVLICKGKCKQSTCHKRRREPRQNSGFFVIEDDGDRIFGRKKDPYYRETAKKHKIQKTTVRTTTTTKTTRKTTTTTTPRTTPKTEARNAFGGNVVDTIDVFNSIAVRAPKIDNESSIFHDFQKRERQPNETEGGDEIFCVTSVKLLICFGILLSILFGSLLCALYWCVKDKIRRDKQHHHQSVASSCRNSTSRQFSAFTHLPHARLHLDYPKFPHLITPYHRFPR